jgi:hypothetical protein
MCLICHDSPEKAGNPKRERSLGLGAQQSTAELATNSGAIAAFQHRIGLA